MSDPGQPPESKTQPPATRADGAACAAGGPCDGLAPLRAWGVLAALLLVVPFVASELLGDPAAAGGGASVPVAAFHFALMPDIASGAEETALAVEATAPDVGPLLPNAQTPLPGLLTGGAPATLEGFGALAAAGYRTYVDLRPLSEAGPEVERAAAAAGLTYLRVPVAGEAELDLATVRALDAILDEPASLPAVLACSSGNRVGALLALRAFWLDGVPPGEALELGKRGGLTRLEPTVRMLLGLPDLEQP